MWLLHTRNLSLEYFPEARTVQYAILSHRWLDDEVLFKDISSESRRQSLAGWTKVQQACTRASCDGFQYIWIDTCCIDKSSSAELSEAINSMYTWYANAAVCYAYLSDVKSHPCAWLDFTSVWFFRGWTLQELIAPRRLEFFNASWEPMGSREDLADQIHSLTRIPTEVLRDSSKLEQYSVAQRISWAARRETTRLEDRAYSLIGLFGVNMAMMYGEGARAFVRLQEEILKISADHTIFAWKLGNGALNRSDGQHYHELVARSPDQFADCASIVRASPLESLQAFYQTNLGLHISLVSRVYASNVYHVALDCEDHGDAGGPHRVGLFLGYPEDSHPDGLVGRRMYLGKDREPYPDRSFQHHQVFREFVVARRPFPDRRSTNRMLGFRILSLTVANENGMLDITQGLDIVARPGAWDVDNQILRMTPGTNGTSMCFAIRVGGKPQVIGKLGWNAGFLPWVWILDQTTISELTPDNADEATVVTEGSVDDLSWPRASHRERSVPQFLEEGFGFNGNKSYTDRRFIGHPMHGILKLDSNDGGGQLVIHVARSKDTDSADLSLWDVAIGVDFNRK